MLCDPDSYSNLMGRDKIFEALEKVKESLKESKMIDMRRIENQAMTLHVQDAQKSLLLAKKEIEKAF